MPGHGDGASAVSTSEPCGQRCHPGDSLRLLEGPPPSSFLSSSSSFFLFPCAFNWKCIYCRARGWTGEREAQQLMKMWLRWGPRGLAPLQHHQLTHAVSFYLSLSVFLAALFVYCSLTYFSRLTPLCFLVFSFRNLAFHFCPPVSFILCLFIALDWACIRSISNANGATWRYISNVLPIANLFKGTIFNPVLLCVFHQGRHNPHNKEDRIKWKRSTLWFGRK